MAALNRTIRTLQAQRPITLEPFAHRHFSEGFIVLRPFKKSFMDLFDKTLRQTGLRKVPMKSFYSTMFLFYGLSIFSNVAMASDGVVPKWPQLFGDSSSSTEASSTPPIATEGPPNYPMNPRFDYGASYPLAPVPGYYGALEQTYGSSVPASPVYGQPISQKHPSQNTSSPVSDQGGIWPDGRNKDYVYPSGIDYWAKKDSALQKQYSTQPVNLRDLNAELQALPPGQRGGYTPPPEPGYGQPLTTAYLLPGEVLQQRRLASLGHSVFVQNTQDAYRWMYHAQTPQTVLQNQAAIPYHAYPPQTVAMAPRVQTRMPAQSPYTVTALEGRAIGLDSYSSTETAYYEWLRLQQIYPGLLPHGTARIIKEADRQYRLYVVGLPDHHMAQFCSLRRAQALTCRFPQ